MAKRRQQIGRQLRRETREQKGRERFVENPTPKKAQHIAGAEANREYKPVLRGLRSEVAGSRRREGELSNWYGGLSNQIGQTQQNAAATSAAQEKALNERLAQAGAQDTSALQAQAAQNAALATQLGGPANTAGQAEAARGAQALAQQRVALTSPVSAERANFQNYLGNRQTSALERGIEAHRLETARRRKIKEDLRAGKKERGEAAVADLEKLREGARDYAIQNKAFGQKNQEFAAERQENAIERAQKARENAADRAVSRFSAGSTRISSEASRRNAATEARKARREEREMRHSGGLTPVERKDRQENRQNATAAVHRTIRANGVPQTPQEWAGLEAIVAKESGVGARQASEAVRRYKQRISARNGGAGAVGKAVAPGF